MTTTTTQPTSSSPNDTETIDARIKTQVEFYFGEPNLRRDKWLRDRIKLDPEGWVPIADLMTFNKIKAITTDGVMVAKALSTSQVLELDSTGVKVRCRNHKDLPNMEDVKDLTARASGFPKEFNLDQVTEKITTTSGGVKPLFVQMRKDNKRFIGEVFVEFNSATEAQTFVKNFASMMGDGYQAQMMSDFLERAKAGQAADRAASSSSGAAAAGATTTSAEDGGVGPTWPGIMIRIDKLSDKKDVTREQFQESFPNVLYVDFRMGSDVAYLRFKDQEDVDKALPIIKEKYSSEFKVLSEEEKQERVKANSNERQNRKRGSADKGKERRGGKPGGSSSSSKRQRR